MIGAKYLHSFSLEGMGIRTQLRTKNNWRTFHVWNGWVHTTGYRGTYKGRNVKYPNYCPKDHVRHHTSYNDEDVSENTVIVTRSSHCDIHRDSKTGRITK